MRIGVSWIKGKLLLGSIFLDFGGKSGSDRGKNVNASSFGLALTFKEASEQLSKGDCYGSSFTHSSLQGWVYKLVNRRETNPRNTFSSFHCWSFMSANCQIRKVFSTSSLKPNSPVICFHSMIYCLLLALTTFGNLYALLVFDYLSPPLACFMRAGVLPFFLFLLPTILPSFFFCCFLSLIFSNHSICT